MVGLIQQRLGKLTQLPAILLASALIAGLLSLQGADDAQSLWQAPLIYLFWLCHSLIGLLLMSGLTRVLSRRLPAAAPDWLQLLCAGVIGALCFAPIAGFLEYVFASVGLGESDAQSLSELFHPGLIASEFFELLPAFVVSWLLLNLSYQSLRNARPVAALPLVEDEGETEAEAEIETPSGLLGKLPPALGQELMVMSSDLNYVHVTTRIGTTMMLYSLSRAAAELGDRGLLIHRSHWVSRAAVVAVRRTGQGVKVEVADGRLIPVSRRKERLVREEFGAMFRRSQQEAFDPKKA